MTSLSASDFPVGIEDFEELVAKGKKYVDKTGVLKQLLESGDAVSLLLRPRRFGKTLSMSMLQNFLELNYADPQDRSRQERLFNQFEVYDNKELCDRHMGRYPVISLSLKDVDGIDFVKAMGSMKTLLSEIFDKYSFLLESDKQSEANKSSLREKIDICSSAKLNLSATENMNMLTEVVKSSLKFLSRMLYREYGLKSIIIVDEYDVPLQKAKANSKRKTSPEELDYYDQMLDVVRGMLSAALKTNSFMKKGFVTGCLKIAHQSVFTGINNFSCYGVKDAPYSKFIGFTREETVNLLKECGMENRLEDVLTWYDGYNIGGSEMLCPWSVLNFLSRALAPENDPATFMPESYWANSSGNDAIEICMKHPDPDDTQRLQNLIDGKTESITLTEFTAYPEIKNDTDFDTFATMMLHTGYFTYAARPVPSDDMAEIRIPNEEVRSCFKKKAERMFSKRNPEWAQSAGSLRDALFAGDAPKVQNIINDMLINFISVRDASHESFYHGFMAGVLSIATSNEIQMTSNQESGDGFHDLILTNDNDLSAAILEFKKTKDKRPVEWIKLCEKAMEQININRYDFNLKQDGYDRILKYGIAFHGKSCKVKMAED
ncbi:MAG: AAA family ATPase [Succinivibrionaceae bacterium]|nr:AAA family ATPase [Succinivibrionaceae bacterium]